MLPADGDKILAEPLAVSLLLLLLTRTDQNIFYGYNSLSSIIWQFSKF